MGTVFPVTSVSGTEIASGTETFSGAGEGAMMVPNARWYEGVSARDFLPLKIRSAMLIASLPETRTIPMAPPLAVEMAQMVDNFVMFYS